MGKDNKVCAIGLWHLGAVASACLADLGYFVVGVDTDASRVDKLNNGIPPVFEPGLDELIKANIHSKKLTYTTNLESALRGTTYVLITFDTPVDEQDEVDLTQIFQTSTQLASYLEDDSLVIVSSQVPVGTCEQMRTLVHKANPALCFDIAYSPENLRLGKAIECFKNPGRIVIGADNPSTLDRAEDFFHVIDAPIIRMTLKTAEMSKHALNAFLGMCISFTNEIANLCDELGADALKVTEALHSDERVGKGAPLKPGLGFAGGTIARDLKVLKNLGKRVGYETPLISGILAVNKQQNKLVGRKLDKIYGSVKNLTIGVLGLTYKAGTSTLRRSAALEIIIELTAKGAIVKAYDPKASFDEIKEHHGFEFCPDPYSVAKDSDALVIITAWPEFGQLDFDRLGKLMRRPILIDAQNMLNEKEMTKKGFHYLGVGTGRQSQ